MIKKLWLLFELIWELLDENEEDDEWNDNSEEVDVNLTFDEVVMFEMLLFKHFVACLCNFSLFGRK